MTQKTLNTKLPAISTLGGDYDARDFNVNIRSKKIDFSTLKILPNVDFDITVSEEADGSFRMVLTSKIPLPKERVLIKFQLKK